MKKTQKRHALLMSALSLLLCVSMLVGTTFAWFTDEVTSGMNTIAAGNLDIELLADGVKVENGTKLFSEVEKWEPGVVVYENLQIANVGTLALKYQMSLNFGKENTLNGHKLSEVLQIAVVDKIPQGADRAAVLASVQNATSLEDFSIAGSLTAGAKTEEKAVVIFWAPGENDNWYNANNGQLTSDEKPLSIEFGVKLLATQLMSEDDSFGTDYDKDAWHNAMKVSTAAELTAAVKAVEDGGTIGLLENITFDEDSAMNSSGTWYEGVIFDGDKSFTIDLNGKTITNDSAVNDYLVFIKNNGSKPNTITFKNGTLEATSSAYSAIATASSNGQKITINLENVAVKGNNSNGAVIKARGGSELNVKAGTVITGANNYVGIECVGNDTVVNVYEGAEIYQNGTGSYVGSLVGVSYNSTVNVYGGKGKSAIGCFIAMTSGGTINVYGGEWIANTDGTAVNGSNKGVLIAQSEKGAKSIVNVYGGTFKGGYCCYGAAAGDAQINIAGGTYNAAPTNYVAAGYQAVERNGKYFVISDSIAEENVVATPAQLKNALTEAADANSGDNTLYLTGDVDLSGSDWTPISIDGYHGAGVITIEGNGATIKGLNAPLFAGGFAGKSGIVIKDLTIADSNIVCTSGLGGGAFVDSSDSMHVITLENCHLVNSTVSGERAGGLIGWYSGYAKLNDGPVKAYVTISDCSVIDSKVIGNGSAGAIAGHPGASDYTYTTIEDCEVKNVEVVSKDEGSWRTGAIVGTANNGHIVINNVTVENVTLTQNGVTADETVLYGRFVPAGTGTLVIDGIAIS